MYKFICKYLKNNDFYHYEIRNFCKNGYSYKHNTVYWKNLHYYWFGLGASSYVLDEMITNTRSFNKYFIKVTISGGVSEFNKDITGEELFRRADKALYDAKTHGRNKVVIFENEQ